MESNRQLKEIEGADKSEGEDCIYVKADQIRRPKLRIPPGIYWTILCCQIHMRE